LPYQNHEALTILPLEPDLPAISDIPAWTDGQKARLIEIKPHIWKELQQINDFFVYNEVVEFERHLSAQIDPALQSCFEPYLQSLRDALKNFDIIAAKAILVQLKRIFQPLES